MLAQRHKMEMFWKEPRTLDPARKDEFYLFTGVHPTRTTDSLRRRQGLDSIDRHELFLAVCESNEVLYARDVNEALGNRDEMFPHATSGTQGSSHQAPFSALASLSPTARGLDVFGEHVRRI